MSGALDSDKDFFGLPVSILRLLDSAVVGIGIRVRWDRRDEDEMGCDLDVTGCDQDGMGWGGICTRTLRLDLAWRRPGTGEVGHVRRERGVGGCALEYAGDAGSVLYSSTVSTQR